MEKLELKSSIEALIYNWLKFDTETIDIASGMREETNFYVNERTNGFRVVMEYPIGYNDVQGGDIGEIEKGKNAKRMGKYTHRDWKKLKLKYKLKPKILSERGYI